MPLRITTSRPSLPALPIAILAVFALIAGAVAPARVDASHAAPLGPRCTNPAVPYTVSFPTGWYYNLPVESEAGSVEQCRFFAPENFTIEPGTEPTGVSIGIGVENVAFDPDEGDETGTVGGRPAYRVEVDSDTPGFEGMTYLYRVDLGDGTTLAARTHEDFVGEYDENKDVLDAMMDSLTFTVGVDRFGGADRYETAALVSQATFAPGVDIAYIAVGTRFPDALAGTPAAAVNTAPTLLVAPSAIPTVTANELTRLQPADIAVLGGDEAISDAVVEGLTAYTTGDVFRLAGDDRYETAAEISSATFGTGGVAYIATGEDFPDALAGGALAGANDGPILLVKENAIPEATADELERLAPAAIVIFGGTDAVSVAVAAELDTYTAGDLYRLGGADRYETATLISQFNYEDADTVYIATGEDFPDALTGGSPAVIDEAPILLVRPNAVPDETAEELDRLGPDRIVILGGPEAVSAAVADVLAAYAGD